MVDEREEERRHRELLENQRRTTEHLVREQQRAASEVARAQQVAAAEISAAQQSIAEQIAKTKGLRAWLFDQIQNGDIAAGLARIVKNGGSLDRVDEVGDTLLTAAVEENLLQSVLLLLEHGASPDSTNKFGLTPLHVASIFGRLDAAQVLLKKGARVDEVDANWGMTAFGHAVWAFQLGMARLMLECGANVNERYRFKNVSPLHLAIFNPCPEWSMPHHPDHPQRVIGMLRFLIENGAEVDGRAEGGVTGLMLAASLSFVPGMELLLDSGADPNLADDSGKTPIQYAQTDEAKALLFRRGAKRAKGCFIATAVCEPTDPCLPVLRRFRDERLEASFSGRMLVKGYYLVSPPIARWLERREGARIFVRERLVRPLARWFQD